MKVIDIINTALQTGQTRFAIELLPPLKGDGTAGVFEAIDPLAELGVAYVNITHHREDVKFLEHPDGMLEKRIVRRRPGTVGISGAIKKRYDIDVVPHLICGGLSKYDIEDELIDMDFLGIDNVLVLRGDCRKGERAFSPHPNGHTYACDLVKQVTDMNRGVFVDGEVDECHHSRFCIGVAGYPEKHSESPNLDSCIRNLKNKVDSGAEYIVTQMCFDNSKIFDFIDRCRAAGIEVPIIPGIKPLSTRTHLTVLPQIFHVDLPDELVREVEKCESNARVRDVGIEWAVGQVRELKSAGIPVIHFYTMGRTDNICRIVRQTL